MFKDLLKKVMVNRPEDPIEFLINELEQVTQGKASKSITFINI